jgi:hypothetical protein
LSRHPTSCLSPTGHPCRLDALVASMCCGSCELPPAPLRRLFGGRVAPPPPFVWSKAIKASRRSAASTPEHPSEAPGIGSSTAQVLGPAQQRPGRTPPDASILAVNRLTRSGCGNKYHQSFMAGCGITPVLIFWTLPDLHWVKFTSETGFELSSSWSNLPCYGVNLNRNILDFMK